jgi:hypothetical protein
VSATVDNLTRIALRFEGLEDLVADLYQAMDTM